MLTEAELRRESARSEFRPELLEKVLRLLELLDALRSHPFLGPRLALKERKRPQAPRALRG